MGSLLKYQVLIVLWRDQGKKCCLVDLNEAKDTAEKKKETLRDKNNTKVKLTEISETWFNPIGSSKIRNMEQNMPSGKTHHIFILNSGSDNALFLIDKMEKELSRYSVKSQHNKSSIDDMKKGIDSSMCLVFLFDKDVIDNNNEMVKEGLSYVSKFSNLMPCILLQHDDISLSLIENKILKMNPYLSKIDTILPVTYQYPHEILVFNENICFLINEKCGSVNEFNKNKSNMIAFLSHVKKEAGKDARILKDHGEKYLLSIDGPLKGSRLFLDSDNLTDLNGLLDQVKKMKVMIVLLSKSYLTRPWCLAELFIAIKSGIKFVTVIIPEGDEYNFTIAKNKILEITANKVLSECNTAIDALKKIDIDVNEMAKTIADHLPTIIAIEFNANKDEDIVNGEIIAIMKRVMDQASI